MRIKDATEAFKAGSDLIATGCSPVMQAAMQAFWLGVEISSAMKGDHSGDTGQIQAWREAARRLVHRHREESLSSSIRAIANREWSRLESSGQTHQLASHPPNQHLQAFVKQVVASEVFGRRFILPRASIGLPAVANASLPPEVNIDAVSLEDYMRQSYQFSLEAEMCSANAHGRQQARAVAALRTAALQDRTSIQYLHYMNARGNCMAIPSSGPECDFRAREWYQLSSRNTTLNQNNPPEERYWEVQGDFVGRNQGRTVRWNRRVVRSGTRSEATMEVLSFYLGGFIAPAPTRESIWRVLLPGPVRNRGGNGIR